MVEEPTAASHSLAQEAEKLQGHVGQFKTGQDASPLTRRPASGSERPSRGDPPRYALRVARQHGAGPQG
jgi:hypothetical protein